MITNASIHDALVLKLIERIIARCEIVIGKSESSLQKQFNTEMDSVLKQRYSKGTKSVMFGVIESIYIDSKIWMHVQQILMADEFITELKDQWDEIEWESKEKKMEAKRIVIEEINDLVRVHFRAMAKVWNAA